MEALTILGSVGGCGLIAALVWFFISRSGGKSDVLEAVTKLKQKLGLAEIDKIETNQNKIKIEIEIKEDLSEAAKTKISKIQENAVTEINNVLKENNISKIHTTVVADWENL
jgi:hypothetical protein